MVMLVRVGGWLEGMMRERCNYEGKIGSWRGLGLGNL